LRHNKFTIEKGCEILSKQSNQRYRKEKEKEHLQKAGVDSTASNSSQNAQEQNKFNREFDAPSGGVNKG
jgi:hypothetical protein